MLQEQEGLRLSDETVRVIRRNKGTRSLGHTDLTEVILSDYAYVARLNYPK